MNAIIFITSLTLAINSFASDNLMYESKFEFSKSGEELTSINICEYYKGVKIECKEGLDRSYSIAELESAGQRAESMKNANLASFAASTILISTLGLGVGFASRSGTSFIVKLTGTFVSGFSVSFSFGQEVYQYGLAHDIAEAITTSNGQALSFFERNTDHLQVLNKIRRLLYDIDNCEQTQRGKRCNKTFKQISF